MDKKIVFIIGAGRSGTSLLSDVLSNNIDACFFNEINDFWKQVSPFLKTDFIPEKHANKKKAIKLKDKLLSKCHKDLLIEKTAANSIRIPFLVNLFPNAYFIHIIRDGREVAISARKKYYGDIRKITQNNNDNLNIGNRIIHLIGQLINKFKNARNPLYYMVNAKRFFYMILKELKLKKYTPWGIHYPGYTYLFNHLSPLELAADQWQYSVLQIKNYFTIKHDCNYHELRYEDLITQTGDEVKKILNFLSLNEPNQINFDINSKINLQFPNLNEQEKNLLESKIKFTLENLDYKN